MENPFDDFFNYDPRKDLENFSKVPTETWLKLGEQKALENFQIAAKAVPAYKDFLKKNKVSPEKIKTIEDFKHLPLTTKENYFRAYPLKDIVMGGDLSKATVIHSTSGSTGKSFFWPKSVLQDSNTYKGQELLYTYYFGIDKIKTLVINCFTMGSWAAGEIVHTSIKMIADKGLPISIISPGLNEELFFEFYQSLQSFYDQIIITGYPSFLKNLANECSFNKIKFKKGKLKIITGGETFSEAWRSFVGEKLYFNDPCKSVANVLGSAETGITGFSTPFTDLLRIYLNGRNNDIKKIFPLASLPCLVQYIPPSRNIEIIEDQIIVTAMGSVPLIRYNTKDRGFIVKPNQVLERIPNKFINTEDILQIPILAIWGRVDGTITFYSLNIYPEQIKHILEMEEVAKKITGRFIVEKIEKSNFDPVFTISVELNSRTKASEVNKNQIRDLIVKELAKINSEYAELLRTYNKKVMPEIKLMEYKTLRSNSGKGTIIMK